jgi:hypothetical protein
VARINSNALGDVDDYLMKLAMGHRSKAARHGYTRLTQNMPTFVTLWENCFDAQEIKVGLNPILHEKAAALKQRVLSAPRFTALSG